ncbi:class I SAM-dependent methyltransferase family protein [Acrocarpospora catenulata]|uniref:class I SAM-dependent methyltransferase family protein n=1 Tax=Acrocarpospora catenulata TaxID=2836182 RepID=UPI00202392EA|nr:class I SAM-dependent methyltransferase family protein [Acrocarpospora catenulata]
MRAVQEQIRLALETTPPGPVKVISVCAGQGRDLLPVLKDHPQRDDVEAHLVELDPRNASAARDAAAALGLRQVDVLTADASLTDHYQGLAPADIVLLCGIFGNITEDHIKRTVSFCPQLCATGGTVIWTRNRRQPDLVPSICAWFEDLGFERQWVSAPDLGYGVGVHRFTGEPQPLAPREQMFDFVGSDKLRNPPPQNA